MLNSVVETSFNQSNHCSELSGLIMFLNTSANTLFIHRSS